MRRLDRSVLQTRRTIPLAAAAALLLGAWSAGAAGPGEACPLLTQAQVSAVLGVAVEPGRPLTPRSPNVCGWAPPGGPKIDGKKVVLSLMTARQFDLGKTPIRGMTKTPVSGIGDDAYYVTAGGLGTALSVKKGGAYFQVKVAGFPVEELKAKEKTIAQEVMARL